MKRTSLTERDASRPSDRANPRPRKAARTNAPEPSTNDSDTEEAIAPLANVPMTPMASHDVQDVMKEVNYLKKEVNDLKKEVKGMKKEWSEMKKERDEAKSSLEGIRLEMANVRKRLDEQEAAIKALTKASQGQVPENLEKEVATTAKAIEATSKQTQGIEQADDEALTGRTPASPLPSTESRNGSEWRGTNLYILNAPEDWEPPQYCPEPPEMDELWLSRRGSKISRHPLANCTSQPGESAIERATRHHGDAKDGV